MYYSKCSLVLTGSFYTSHQIGLLICIFLQPNHSLPSLYCQFVTYQTTVPIRSGQSRALRTKTNQVSTGKQRTASQSPGSSPVRPFADFLGTEFEWNETDTPGLRSISPNWHHAPWRINRTRVKRPGYPRMINDPVPPRRATIRLGAQKYDKLNSMSCYCCYYSYHVFYRFTLRHNPHALDTTTFAKLYNVIVNHT